MYPKPDWLTKSTCTYSVQFSPSVVSNALQSHELQHARPPCLSPTPGVYPLMSTQSVMPSTHLILCHPLLLLPPIPPASESFPMSQLFAWGGQSTRVSALASFPPKNTQDWSPLEWTGWIFLRDKMRPYTSELIFISKCLIHVDVVVMGLPEMMQSCY